MWKCNNLSLRHVAARPCIMAGQKRAQPCGKNLSAGKEDQADIPDQAQDQAKQMQRQGGIYAPMPLRDGDSKKG